MMHDFTTTRYFPYQPEPTRIEKGRMILVADKVDLVGTAGLSMDTPYEVLEYDPLGLVVIKNDNGFLKTYDADRFVVSHLQLVK